MSDFDKEAEREKLRKKYERDKADREAAQRMSDLLLKGATMTNTHCGVCGDPLFSQDGVEFCPSCHGSPQGVEAAASDAEDTDTQSTADQESATPTPDQQASGDAAPAESGAAVGTADTSESGPDEATDIDVAPRSSSRSETTDERSSSGARSTSGSRQPSRSSASSAPSSAGTVDASLETAQASLVETLERFAAEAAGTDDPRYAKECLAAAREAGEALATLRR